MTAPSVREALEAERAELIAKNEAATSWGAAVGARCERILDIDRQLRALATPPAPTPSAALPPDRYRLVNYLERLPTKTRLFNGEAVDVVEPQYVLASDRDDIVRLLTALLPDAAAIRAAAFEEAARELEQSYPDHAWLNAACAAIRAMITAAQQEQNDA